MRKQRPISAKSIKKKKSVKPNGQKTLPSLPSMLIIGAERSEQKIRKLQENYGILFDLSNGSHLVYECDIEVRQKSNCEARSLLD